MQTGAVDGDRGIAAAAAAAQHAGVCASFWREFDLDAYRKALDDRGLAVAAAQEASMKSRRQLADTTKSFRKTADAEVVSAVSPLLKSYQEEVDRLTHRSKAAESAFLDVYQRLYEAPDPAPALSEALDGAARLTDAESAIARVAQEFEEFRAEAEGLRNQDLTLRRTEERARSLEAQLAEKDKEIAAAAAAIPAAAVAGVGEESAEDFAEREAALELALSEARLGLDNMRRLHQASENRLFALQRDQEAAAVGDDGEADLAAAEVDEARDRLAAMEAEKAALIAQVDRMRAATSTEGAVSLSTSGTLEQRLRAEVASQRDIISRLRADVDAANEAADVAVTTASDKGRELRTHVQGCEARVRELSCQLAARPSVDEVQELRLQVRGLQMVTGLPSPDDDDSSGNSGSNGGKSGAGGLEAMLVERARRCEHDAATARLAAVKAQDEALSAASRGQELEGEVLRLTDLATQLEEDLLTAAAASGVGSSSGRRATDYGNAAALSTADDGSGPCGSQEAEDGDRSMMRILASQRDRLRERATRLEDGAAALGQQLAAAQAQVAEGRRDNVALVERLKFVQSFPKDKGGGGGAESRYTASYNASVDPFAAWRSRAAEERRAGMQLHDRFLYAAAQMVAGHPMARAVVCIYTLLLHFLVFAVLSRAAHQDSAADILCGAAAGKHSIVLPQVAENGRISDPIASASIASSLDGNSSGLGISQRGF